MASDARTATCDNDAIKSSKAQIRKTIAVSGFPGFPSDLIFGDIPAVANGEGKLAMKRKGTVKSRDRIVREDGMH